MGHKLDNSCEEEPSSTPSNSSAIRHSDTVATLEKPQAQDGEREVTLRDFVIDCLTEDPALDGIEVVVYGLRDKNTARTEKITQTTWKYHGEIKLHLDMDEVILSVESEYVVGYITFSKGELAAFMGLDHHTKLERDFTVLEKHGPLLRLTFVLGALQKEYIASESLTRQSAVDGTPEWHILDMAMWLDNLDLSFLTRFERTGDLADIQNAISTEQRAVDLGPEGHATMPSRFNNLGHTFYMRFNITCNLSDIENAISAIQSAIDLTPEGHAELPSRINNLGAWFETRFDCTGNFADLEMAISAQQRAINLAPEEHANMTVWLNNLGFAFQTCFDRTSSLTDLEKAISAQQRAVDLTPEGHEDMPVWLENLGSSLGKRFDRTSNFEDLENAISVQQRAIDLTPDGHADMPLRLRNLGLSIRKRFDRTFSPPDLEKTIFNLQKCVDLTPEGHRNFHLRLNDLGSCFQTRFNHTGDIADLEKAISIQQSAINFTPEGDADMPMRFNDLRVSYQMRFERTGNLADLTNAISALQTAIELAPEGHENMPSLLNNLGLSFQKQFDNTRNLADIEIAISTQQRALDLVPEGHAYKPLFLNNLGISLQTRFNHAGDFVDLENAISAQQRAVNLTPEGHGDMPKRLNTLGSCFRERFERTGNLADLESATSSQKRAINLTPEGDKNMAVRLSNLGLTFWTRFDRTGNIEDVENAISTQKRVIDLTPDGHADMPVYLSNLGISFKARFNRSSNLSDLENAISAQQRAVNLTPVGHPDLALMLSNLGTAFQTRFDHTGSLTDIENAISAQQRSVHLTPDGHGDTFLRLNNLGLSFQLRFNRTKNVADIENSISAQRRAIDLIPDGYASMPSFLNNLGISFQGRFERNGNLIDLEHAISSHQKALDLIPQGHANMALFLTNLGRSFHRQFNRTGNLADLEKAISHQQRAVDITREGHAAKPMWLNNLAVSLCKRFDCTDNLADLENAIFTQQRAVHTTPEGHGDKSHFLMSLARSLVTRFLSMHNTEDIHTAISTVRRSATQITGDPSTRLEAARYWAKWSRVYDKSQLLDAFSVAIQLLSQVAGLEQTIHNRHQTLISVSDITSSATAAAIDDSKLDTAISWLEQGRCLVWNQINHLRTPAEDLRLYNPSLADRFLLVARALEVSGSRQERHSTFSVGNMTEMISLQEEMHKHVDLANEWNELLQEIRRIPELEDFLQPPQVSKILSRLPSDGPVVIFNIHEDRCDALALRFGHESPLHIPLNTFSLQLAIQLADDLRRYLKAPHVRQMRLEAGRDGSRWQPQSSEGAVMSKILRELWEHVAKPILESLSYSSHCSSLPRIWWCPTGPLAFLPIHAAGIYGKQGEPTGPCVSDYVVSSYTPTITDLLDKINATSTKDVEPISHLIISQSEPPKSSPGLSPLSGAKEETHALKNMIGPPSKSLLLENASATVSRVKEEMRSHGWVHFACHAIQDAAQPLKSGVQLYDGRLEVMEMLKQKLPDADLAFLSACQTSTGDEQLADEVVHLAAGMLAAGYRSVVATMWSIKDQYGPVVAKDFYEHLLAENSAGRRLDGANAARGLHYAMQKLRKELGDTERALLIWVPYVHFGV